MPISGFFQFGGQGFRDSNVSPQELELMAQETVSGTHNVETGITTKGRLLTEQELSTLASKGVNITQFENQFIPTGGRSGAGPQSTLAIDEIMGRWSGVAPFVSEPIPQQEDTVYPVSPVVSDDPIAQMIFGPTKPSYDQGQTITTTAEIQAATKERARIAAERARIAASQAASSDQSFMSYITPSAAKVSVSDDDIVTIVTPPSYEPTGPTDAEIAAEARAIVPKPVVNMYNTIFGDNDVAVASDSSSSNISASIFGGDNIFSSGYAPVTPPPKKKETITTFFDADY